MVDISKDELRSMKIQLAKLQLESKLRSNLTTELDKQKQRARIAEDIAKSKSEQIENIAKQLSKYLSPQLYDSIFSGEKKAKIESEKKFLSIFFSDIVSFTSISDDMNSKSLTDMLNTYLSKMSDIALSFGGTIDKYIGDAIMVFFGDPVSKGYRNDAINCVRMAIAMQKKMKEMSFEFTSKYKLTIPLKIRIGINSGECTVGNFGSDRRLDYTVIGGAVNLASRLETYSKTSGILISENTKSLIENDVKTSVAKNISIKGFDNEIKTYEVLF